MAQLRRLQSSLLSLMLRLETCRLGLRGIRSLRRLQQKPGSAAEQLVVITTSELQLVANSHFSDGVRVVRVQDLVLSRVRWPDCHLTSCRALHSK